MSSVLSVTDIIGHHQSTVDMTSKCDVECDTQCDMHQHILTDHATVYIWDINQHLSTHLVHTEINNDIYGRTCDHVGHFDHCSIAARDRPDQVTVSQILLGEPISLPTVLPALNRNTNNNFQFYFYSNRNYCWCFDSELAVLSAMKLAHQAGSVRR